MKFSTLSATTMSIVTLCSVSQAWPLLNLHQKRDPIPAPQSYSVVPVDGGANSGSRTVTNVVTQTQVQTIVTTLTAGGSENPTGTISPVTVATETLVVAPSVTSIPYDDGQWHGTYYYRSTLTDVLVPVSTSKTSSQATSSPSTTLKTSCSSTITAAPQNWVAAPTTSAQSSTATDWPNYYGKWRDIPKNGSWWGKSVVDKIEAGLAKIS